MDAFLLFLGENTDVLFAFLAAVSKYLTRSWKGMLPLAYAEGLQSSMAGKAW